VPVTTVVLQVARMTRAAMREHRQRNAGGKTGREGAEQETASRPSSRGTVDAG
jgi:hypothetical protein